MDKQEYWDGRYASEGKIWGESPSQSAHEALKLFLANHIQSVLVPGSGYGRNTKLFSADGLNVTGIEISETAYKIAIQFDPRSKFYRGTVLDMSFDHRPYDAIYCFNVLHLFRLPERELFLRQCLARLKPMGLAYFTVFSNKESTFGQGNETEPNTFESRPNRPVHYFTGDDLDRHFQDFKIIKIGTITDPEDHGGQAHVHILRYIFVRKKK
jgi:2-polyprenyl-3-methyl-5-hydroxy-6-metoxy-1,4-benzoquinol methylase